MKISADGRYIGLRSRTHSNELNTSDVYSIDTPTGEELPITTPADGVVSGSELSADGDRFVFSTDKAIKVNDQSGGRDVYAADLDLSAFAFTFLQRVSEAVGRFEVTGDSYAPTISQDGETVTILSQSRALILLHKGFFDEDDGFQKKL